MKKPLVIALSVFCGLLLLGAAAYLVWRSRRTADESDTSVSGFIEDIGDDIITTIVPETNQDTETMETPSTPATSVPSVPTVSGKTATGLVAYAKMQLGRPYWFGTSGQIATQDLLEKKRKAYPKYYTANDFESQIGQKVHDCCGLIEGYFWSQSANAAAQYGSNGFADTTADNLLNKAAEKGPIGTIPEIPGLSVHMSGHVGIYIGNGEVIEARGHAYNVCKTKLSERGWKYWAKIPGIAY